MKILFLSITSEIGGADLALLRTVSELDRSGFEPVVGLPGDGPLVERFRSEGARVCFFPMMRMRRTLNPFWGLGYLLGFRRACRRIAEFARAEGVGLIHANSLPNPYGAGAARLAGLPCVWHVREIDIRPRMVRNFLVDMAARRAGALVAVSRTVASEVLGGKGDGKVRVIHDSVDLDAFRPDASAGAKLRARFGLPPDCRLAGIWCRFDEWKGLPVAISAAGRLARERPGFRMLIAGGPTAGHERYAEELRGLAEREAGQAIVFTGWLDPEEMPGFVAGLDVAVHASTSPEPFGLVIAEAMAAGTPLVAPRLGSPLELVDDGRDGLLYEAGSPAALAGVVERLLGDEQLAADCSAAGRAKAEALFDVRLNVRKLEDVYRELAGGSRK